MRSLTKVLGILALLLVAVPASATITVVARYRLGEADPGAVAGNVANATTVDSIAALNLPRVGSPTYSSLNPAFIGSTLSVNFPGTGDGFLLPGSYPTNVVDNFGVEAWVLWNGNNPNGGTTIAYNGHGCCSGWGLLRDANKVALLYGGISVTDGGVLPQGVWTEVALVRASGLATIYINGVATGTFAGAPAAPNSFLPFPSGTDIGSNGNFNPSFGGNIDEVRFFTFAPGAFAVSDLNLVSTNVPTLGPAALALMGLLLAGAAFLLLRR